jgi:hypothetical protein
MQCFLNEDPQVPDFLRGREQNWQRLGPVFDPRLFMLSRGDTSGVLWYDFVSKENIGNYFLFMCQMETFGSDAGPLIFIYIYIIQFVAPRGLVVSVLATGPTGHSVLVQARPRPVDIYGW